MRPSVLPKRVQLGRRGGDVRTIKSFFIDFLESHSTEKFHSFRATTDPDSERKVFRRPHILVSARNGIPIPHQTNRLS